MSIDLPALFFSASGRIGRLRFWIGALALLFLGDAAATFLRSWFAPGIQPQLIDFTVTALLAWPDFCIGRKRLADRGRGIFFALAYTGYSLLAALISIFWPLLSEKPDGSFESSLFLAAIYTCTLFFVVECGVLKGVKGPNAYGPEPTLP